MWVTEETLTLAPSFHFKRLAGVLSRPVEPPTFSLTRMLLISAVSLACLEIEMRRRLTLDATGFTH